MSTKRKKKKYTMSRFRNFSNRIIKQLGKAKSFERYLQLYGRANFMNKEMNVNLASKIKPEDYKDIPHSTLLKFMSFYKDQEDVRKYAIQAHKTFCCPISEQILDMRDSFFISLKGQQEIISSKGLDMLVAAHGTEVLKIVNT